MDMRTRIADGLKNAMKNKEAERLSTLRLINAAIKDMDIARRAEDGDTAVTDDDVLQI
ncbi:GatB/YqeY domain-containing protein, partial [Escherichia coli]|nr:GatB/YqeY domain-containing protein [Escherichia coli]